MFWDDYHHIQISQRNASCTYMKTGNSYISKPKEILEQDFRAPL